MPTLPPSSATAVHEPAVVAVPETGWPAESLGKLGAAESAGALRPLLTDPEELVRLAAERALSCLGC